MGGDGPITKGGGDGNEPVILARREARKTVDSAAYTFDRPRAGVMR